MKTTAIRSIAVSALCASLLGAAAMASASDWHGRDYRRPVVIRGGGPRFGLGLDVVIGGPAYIAPAYCPPVYYGGPVIEPEIVIGGGGYYHGGHAYDRGRFDRDDHIDRGRDRDRGRRGH